MQIELFLLFLRNKRKNAYVGIINNNSKEINTVKKLILKKLDNRRVNPNSDYEKGIRIIFKLSLLSFKM